MKTQPRVDLQSIFTYLIPFLLFNSLVDRSHCAPALEGDDTDGGCYYMFNHYGEGDRILTNEPCLNCTCHNSMLMCYLRVCPFTKPIGQDCTIEKKPDQCCPVISCPQVPVSLVTPSALTSTTASTTSLASVTESTDLANYERGCEIEGKNYPDGAQVEGDPTKPCELCYCIRNRTACVMQECILHVEGCQPVFQPGVCCPVRYQCDYPPRLTDQSTVTDLITTTIKSIFTSTPQPGGCFLDGEYYADGSQIPGAGPSPSPCDHCYCMRGEVVCAVQECGAPLENEGGNCTAIAPPPGLCCPEKYTCGDDISTDESGTTVMPSGDVAEEKVSEIANQDSPVASSSDEPTVESQTVSMGIPDVSEKVESTTVGQGEEKQTTTGPLMDTPDVVQDAVPVGTDSQDEVKDMQPQSAEKPTSQPSLDDEDGIMDGTTQSPEPHKVVEPSKLSEQLEHPEPSPPAMVGVDTDQGVTTEVPISGTSPVSISDSEGIAASTEAAVSSDKDSVPQLDGTGTDKLSDTADQDGTATTSHENLVDTSSEKPSESQTDLLESSTQNIFAVSEPPKSTEKSVDSEDDRITVASTEKISSENFISSTEKAGEDVTVSASYDESDESSKDAVVPVTSQPTEVSSGSPEVESDGQIQESSTPGAHVPSSEQPSSASSELPIESSTELAHESSTELPASGVILPIDEDAMKDSPPVETDDVQTQHTTMPTDTSSPDKESSGEEVSVTTMKTEEHAPASEAQMTSSQLPVPKEPVDESESDKQGQTTVTPTGVMNLDQVSNTEQPSVDTITSSPDHVVEPSDGDQESPEKPQPTTSSPVADFVSDQVSSGSPQSDDSPVESTSTGPESMKGEQEVGTTQSPSIQDVASESSSKMTESSDIASSTGSLGSSPGTDVDKEVSADASSPRPLHHEILGEMTVSSTPEPAESLSMHTTTTEAPESKPPALPSGSEADNEIGDDKISHDGTVATTPEPSSTPGQQESVTQQSAMIDGDVESKLGQSGTSTQSSVGGESGAQAVEQATEQPIPVPDSGDHIDSTQTPLNVQDMEVDHVDTTGEHTTTKPQDSSGADKVSDAIEPEKPSDLSETGQAQGTEKPVGESEVEKVPGVSETVKPEVSDVELTTEKPQEVPATSADDKPQSDPIQIGAEPETTEMPVDVETSTKSPVQPTASEDGVTQSPVPESQGEGKVTESPVPSIGDEQEKPTEATAHDDTSVGSGPSESEKDTSSVSQSTEGPMQVGDVETPTTQSTQAGDSEDMPGATQTPTQQDDDTTAPPTMGDASSEPVLSDSKLISDQPVEASTSSPMIGEAVQDQENLPTVTDSSSHVELGNTTPENVEDGASPTMKTPSMESEKVEGSMVSATDAPVSTDKDQMVEGIDSQTTIRPVVPSEDKTPEEVTTVKSEDSEQPQPDSDVLADGVSEGDQVQPLPDSTTQRVPDTSADMGATIIPPVKEVMSPEVPPVSLVAEDSVVPTTVSSVSEQSVGSTEMPPSESLPGDGSIGVTIASDDPENVPVTTEVPSGVQQTGNEIKDSTTQSTVDSDVQSTSSPSAGEVSLSSGSTEQTPTESSTKGSTVMDFEASMSDGVNKEQEEKGTSIAPEEVERPTEKPSKDSEDLMSSTQKPDSDGVDLGVTVHTPSAPVAEDMKDTISEKLGNVTATEVPPTGDSETDSPPRVPGEGYCFVEGKTYENGSSIPPTTPCHIVCACQNSIVHCLLVHCKPPPSDTGDCKPVYKSGVCCPTYDCDNSDDQVTVTVTPGPGLGLTNESNVFTVTPETPSAETSEASLDESSAPNITETGTTIGPISSDSEDIESSNVSSAEDNKGEPADTDGSSEIAKPIHDSTFGDSFETDNISSSQPTTTAASLTNLHSSEPSTSVEDSMTSVNATGDEPFESSSEAPEHIPSSSQAPESQAMEIGGLGGMSEESNATSDESSPLSPGNFYPVTTTTTITPSSAAWPYPTPTPASSVMSTGACLFDGRVYMSAQQIPRDDPCDFCFCFRGDIICLQQSCPPPIPGCYEEPIPGFCCPRYECPVGNGNSTEPPLFPPSYYHNQILNGVGAGQNPGAVAANMPTGPGCEIQGEYYESGQVITSTSGPCLECRCGATGMMECDPRECQPEPMLRKMIAAITTSR